ncbi:succinylglutamate desuccinylase/aspartoacylase domain-containing protein [Sneathiella chinensis]|uniref:Succinylglutamate desuccinylase n=1 Tax=Sneathiella chinensis TaxID=349750 RepID=A0ABQ5U6Q4_9PROT|nr:succinylglutamate desuccinylase/aspartoacylase family protein [Sneathiella chinensis]GLQ06903.1 succinylglutamate desuccinylase [Sneathiella chinensis]
MSTEQKSEFTIELTAPDISAYKTGNRGIEYVTTFDSGVEGPHALVSAVVHGNELCGAIAVDHLFKQDVRPTRGKLSLAFMNVDAYHNFDPANPMDSRYVEEDFNRVWAKDVLDGDRDSVELRRARAVRPLIDEVDYLLDIHSMTITPEPLMMAGPIAKGRVIAKQVGLPETVISDAGHKAGLRMRDYGDFINPDSHKNALLMECGMHWVKESGDLAIETAYRFLDVLGMIDPELAEKFGPKTLPQAQRFVESSGPYTIKTDNFRFNEKFSGGEVFDKAGTVIAHDGDEPVTTPYDDCVLIMPNLRLRKDESALRFGRLIEV